MQDRFPRFESRGAAVPLSQSVPATPSRPAVITPIAEFEAHRGAITGMAYSEDGHWIVTAGEDATLKVWDAAYHTLIRTIELDDGRATALALGGVRALTGPPTARRRGTCSAPRDRDGVAQRGEHSAALYRDATRCHAATMGRAVGTPIRLPRPR
jgi:hypothetical protein